MAKFRAYAEAILLPLALLFCLVEGEDGPKSSNQYCIIGAGPGGLQMGYFLERAGRDYVIFEKNTTAGAFFLHYPRHRTLISINKRHTGSTNKEFSFRHDWNTLIADDETLQMRYYSREYFPKADDYIRYLQDYASKLNLKIQYNTEITWVGQRPEGDFILRDQDETTHSCQVLLVSTGLWVPNIPEGLPGLELAEGYESVSIDPEDFEGKVVLILGRGNAGFETADNIVGHTAYIHMASRSRIRMAYQTHYVGDLRAINNNLVDTYQLKSLDGQFEADLSAEYIEATLEKHGDGKFYLNAGVDLDEYDEADNNVFRLPFDAVIRCMGFNFDFSIFNDSVCPPPSPAGKNKYPLIKENYEAANTSGMYFAGAATHSLDYRKSAGGFIHGYRYTARALFRHLQWRYHGIPWPSVTLPVTDLLNHLVKRINEASGPYQMFGVLGDIMLLRDNGTVVFLEEVPMQALPMFQELTGHEIGSFVIWNFEYGRDYSGPGKDVLREDRATGEPTRAHKSNFLHPVLYYYKNPPQPDSTWVSGSFPEPELYHHVVEDFLTDWTARRSHIIPLRRFLEGCLQTDLRDFMAETCFELILVHGDNIPLGCKQHYLQGHGITSSDGIIDFGPPEAFEL